MEADWKMEGTQQPLLLEDRHSQKKQQTQRYLVGFNLSWLASLCVQFFSLLVNSVGQRWLKPTTRYLAADPQSWKPLGGTGSAQNSPPAPPVWSHFDAGYA